MVDDLAQFGSQFDFITIIAAYIQDLINGPAAHFGIPPGLSRRQLKRLLAPVQVWGIMLSPDAEMLMFSVPRSQVGQAERLLGEAKISVLVVKD